MQNFGISQYQNQTIVNHPAAAVPKELAPAGNAPLQQMKAGSVFEGIVTEVKDGQVVIGFNNGQTLNAHMEQGVSLRPGEPMMFEVKSNDGKQISIRPVALESSLNPTLSKALMAAGLPATARNLSLVNAMMNQQMPIDKSSLQQMARTVMGNKQADLETLLQMKKLGFTINEESITQFDNYKNNSHSLLKQFTGIMDSISELMEKGNLNNKQLLEFQKQFLDVFKEPAAMPEQKATDPQGNNKIAAVHELITEGSVPKQNGANITNEANSQQANSANPQAVPRAMVQPAAPPVADPQTVAQATEQQTLSPVMEQQAVPPVMEPQTASSVMEPQTAALAMEPQTVPPAMEQKNSSLAMDREMPGSQAPPELALTPKQQETLELKLRQFPGMEEDPVIFKDGKLNTASSPREILESIIHTLQNKEGYTKEAFQELLSGKEYKTLVKQVMEQQWLMKPEEVASKENMEKLYERVKQQMEKLEVLLANTGKETAAANKNVTNVRSNLEFMNQVNQLYNYIQIPLKFFNQNAHSDLYVYTNKKKLQEKDGELTALLHLDMEHLGASDIYIKMQGNKVTTNFYLSDGISLGLLQEHMAELQERLNEKGYQCEVHLENRQEKVDFVEDFLENEKPLGKVRRYSFDVLA